MHDIRAIRDNPEAFDAALARRGIGPMATTLLAKDEARRTAETRVQELQAARNKAAKAIGAKKARGEDAAAEIDAVAQTKAAEAQAEAEARSAAEALAKALSEIPNLPDGDVPDGKSEDDNKEVRQTGVPPQLGFKPKEHFELGEALGLMDFERAARLSGSRFVVLTGALARLERALGAFMLDIHTQEFGYVETNPPALVKDAALYGTGQLPKFNDDLFKTKEIVQEKKREWINQQVDLRVNKQLDWQDGSKSSGKIHNTQEIFAEINEIHQEADVNPEFEIAFWLIPTAEVPLTNLVAGETLSEASLPKRNTALTLCFRSEAGAAGKDTRGMIRQHQFSKVELVSVVKPEDSDAELERMTGCAEEVLRRLGLAFRTVMLCTGDMGFAAAKTYDIEVWLPGQGRYREISSCSNTRDFQARRMNARFKRDGAKKPEFVHTLNGSGVALGRALIAVMENYQNADGSIRVPEVLQPYLGGLTVISKVTG